MESRKTQIPPHLQPKWVPSLSDDTSEFGQTSSIHFNPLMEVIPSRTPRPIIKVIFINTCLERERDILQKDPESMNTFWDLGGGRWAKKNEQGMKEKSTMPWTLFNLNRKMELLIINELEIFQYDVSSSCPAWKMKFNELPDYSCSQQAQTASDKPAYTCQVLGVQRWIVPSQSLPSQARRQTWRQMN